MAVTRTALSGAANYTGSQTATSQSITLSTNSAGDLLVIFACSRGATTAMGAPSGWTLVGSIVSTAGTGGTTEVYAKTSGGAEGASITHTWTGARGAGFRCATYSGGTDFDVEVSTVKEDSTAVSTLTAASIDADRAGMLIGVVSRSQSGATFTSGLTTELFDGGNASPNVAMAAYEESIVAAGATGTRSFTASGTAGTRLSAVMALIRETDSGGISLTAAHTLEAITTSTTAETTSTATADQSLSAITTAVTAATTSTAIADHQLEAITTSASINVGSTVEITAAHTLEAITSSAIAQTATEATATHTLEAITTTATAATETAIAASHNLEAITTSATIEIGDIVLIQAHHTLEAITSSATAATATAATASHSLEAIAASGEIAIATSATADHQLEAITTSASIEILGTVEIDANHTLPTITSSAVAATATEAIAHHNLSAITTSASMAIVVACRVDSVSVTRQSIQASVSNSRIQINSITRNWRA